MKVENIKNAHKVEFWNKNKKWVMRLYNKNLEDAGFGEYFADDFYLKSHINILNQIIITKMIRPDLTVRFY